MAAVGVTIASGFLLTSTFTEVEWCPDYSASTGTFSSSGTASEALVGETVRTLVAVGAFTFEPEAAPAVPAGMIFRRNPPPQISGNLGTTQSRGTFRVGGTAPVEGQDVQVDFGDGFGTLLAGTIQTVTQVFEGLPRYLAWDIVVVDYLWALSGRCPVACFTKVSATSVVRALVAAYGLGFTTIAVEAALPDVTVVFDGSKNLVDCLAEVATQVGNCYFYADKLHDVHFFQTETTNPPDQLNNTTNRTVLFDPQITYERDASQLRNRIPVAGVSTTTTAITRTGGTQIPVEDITYFQSPGMITVGCQRLRVTGATSTKSAILQPSNAGAFRAAQALDPALGFVLSGKIHVIPRYAMSYINADGSDSAKTAPVYPTIFVYQTVGTGIAGSLTPAAGGAVPQGVVIQYAFSYYTDDGETSIMNLGAVNLGGANNAVDVLIPATGNSQINGAYIWRTFGGGTDFYFVGDSPGQGLRTFTDVEPEIKLGQLAPLDAFGVQSPNTTGYQVLISGIPSAPSAALARKLWRSTDYIVNRNSWSPWTLLATIDDPTISSYLDNEETQRGDEFLHDGNQDPITTKTSPTTVSPQVKGFLNVSGVTEAIPDGATVSLFVEVNDLASQAAWAAKMGGDGIREMPMVHESALKTYTQLTSFANAILAVFAVPIETVVYHTRDIKSVAGKDIDIDLVDPPIVTNLKIQAVAIDLIRYQPGEAPRYAVTASSVKFTIADLLSQVLGAAKRGAGRL